MADAVLQGLANSLGPANDYSGFFHAQALQQQNRFHKDQLAQQKQEFDERQQDKQTARNATTYDHVAASLNDKNFLTGTNYDPYVTGTLSGLRARAAELAGKGATESDIQMAIGPDMAKFNTNVAQMKNAEQMRKNSIQKLSKVPGIDVDALDSASRQRMAQDFNPETGKAPDGNTDYAQQVLNESPELVANDAGLAAQFNGTKREAFGNTYQKNIKGVANNISYKGQQLPWQSVSDETDPETGVPKGLVTHSKDATDKDGNIIKGYGVAPDEVMNVFMNRPGVAPYINGETNKAFKQAGQDVPPVDSHEYKQMQGHVLYQYLDANSPHNIIPDVKPTAAEQRLAVTVKPEFQQQRVDAAYDTSAARAEARADVKGEGGSGGGAPKVKTTLPGLVADLYNGNITDAPTTTDANGNTVQDVTSMGPKGQWKFGHGSHDVYKQVTFDPEKKVLTATKKDGTQVVIPEAQAGQFAASHAEPNGTPLNSVKPTLTNAGFQGGKFTKATPNTSFIETKKADQEEALHQNAAKIDKGLSGDVSDLKGVKTPAGTIKTVEERTLTSWLPGRDKYKVTLDNGKTQTFTDKPALERYLKGSSISAPAKAPLEDLRKKYNY